MAQEKLPAYLFESNPPVEDEWVDRLFHNRQPELRSALALLRAKTTLPKIHVIHGLRRSGKSHLAKKVLLEVRREGLPFVTFEVNANAQGTTRAVLQDLFFKLWHCIKDVEESQVPEGAQGIYELGLAYLGGLQGLVSGEDKDISFEEVAGKAEGIGADVKLGATSLPGMHLSLSGKVELKEETRRRWAKAGPTDRDLVEYLRYQVDLLAVLHPGKRVLVLVDDLDLLERASSEGKNEESDALILLLKPLAESRSVLLLATIRHVFFNGREKDFKDFIKVGLLRSSDLTQIYRRHVEAFNAGEEVFAEPALDWLVRSAEGKVGIFLHRCMELWRRFQPERDNPISVGDVKLFIKEELEELRQDSQHIKVLIPITQAVRSGQLEVELPGVEESGLLYRILTPVTDRPNIYSINRLYSEVLQEEAAAKAQPR